MTTFLDTSALVRRYVATAGHDLVTATMAADAGWCASALARTEALLVLHRLATGRVAQAGLWDALRADWAAVAVVPVDDRCLARAAELGAAFALDTVDAVHLAAADRLPRPLRYVTFHARQLPAAAELGFDVIAPVEA